MQAAGFLVVIPTGVKAVHVDIQAVGFAFRDCLFLRSC